MPRRCTLGRCHRQVSGSPACGTCTFIPTGKRISGAIHCQRCNRDTHHAGLPQRDREWRKQVEAGQLIGPHMSIGSPIIDGPKPLWPGSISVSDEEEARQVVDQAKQHGADFVKVYQLLSREEYLAIADEPKKQVSIYEGTCADLSLGQGGVERWTRRASSIWLAFFLRALHTMQEASCTPSRPT